MAKDVLINEQMKEERIKQIRDVSLKLFALKGFDNVKMNDIAKTVGCSHGLLYHYYESKDAIFHDLIEHHKNEVGRFNLFIHDKDLTAKEQLIHFCDQVAHLLMENEEQFYYFVMFTTFEYQKTLPPPPHVIKDSNKHFSFKECLKQILEEGQKEGSVIDEDAKGLADYLYATIRGLIYLRIYSYHDSYTFDNSNILKRVILKNV